MHKKTWVIMFVSIFVLLTLFFISCTLDETSQTSRTVYITNTGNKYHRYSCRYVQQSRIAISLDTAKARGYTACSVCSP